MAEERRANPNPMDVGGIVAIIYTLGFLALATLLYFVPIPATNKDALLYLFGILSGIQLSIMAYLYGASKAAEATQRATEQRQGRAAAVVEEIAKKVAEPVPPTEKSGEQLKTDTVHVEAQTATLTEKDKP